MSKTTFTILSVAVIFALLIVVGPFITIWALNTLFPVLAIEYSIWTWLAVICLGGLFKANIVKKD